MAQRLNRTITEHIASTTLQWLDDDKLTFIWNTEIVLVHYRRENKTYRILTDHEEETLTAIPEWLDGAIQTDSEEED